MKLLHALLALQLLVGTGAGQPARSGQAVPLPKRPTAFVQSLYRQIVTRHPSGIPRGQDWAVFSPYLSAALVKKVDLFNACAADWASKHKDPDEPMKAPFGIFESGMFSGGDERTSPRFYRVEQSQPIQRGSYEVTVKLTWRDDPPFHYWENWRVKAVLIPQNGGLALDDVVYLEDRKQNKADWTLTRLLSSGCDGPRWVGDDGSTPTPPLRQRAMWVR
jgi:hypothetical protein